MAITSSFPHRLNKDGSYDSICSHCFMTVASHTSESELEPLEYDHQCFGDFAMRKEEMECERVFAMEQAIPRAR